MHPFRVFKILLGLCFLFCLGLGISAEEAKEPPTLFRKDRPEIIPLWRRVADFTPTLRSVETAVISPNGRFVLSGSKFSYQLILWRVLDGTAVWDRQLEAEVEAVAFSPDSRFIAAGDEAFKVTIWNLNGEAIRELEHDAGFDGITWSPDGRFVAAGSEKGEVVIWNTQTWEIERILKAGNTVNSLQFSKDTRYLIAGGNRMNPDPENRNDRHGFVMAWDVSQDWKKIHDLRAQERSSKSIRFHPDEHSFAVAGFANQVKVFRFPEGGEIATINVDDRLEAIAYHPEGNFLFVGGHGDTMQVYETSGYTLIHEFPCSRIEYIDFSPDGRLMTTGHEDSGLLQLFLFMSRLESRKDYNALSKEILTNRDLR